MKKLITILAVLFSLSAFATDGDTLIYTIVQNGDTISFTYKDTTQVIKIFDTIIKDNEIIDTYTNIFSSTTIIKTQVNRADLFRIYKVMWLEDGIWNNRYYKDGPPSEMIKAKNYVEYLKSLIPK